MGRSFEEETREELRALREEVTHLTKISRALAHMQGIAFDELHIADEELVYFYGFVKEFSSTERWPREKEDELLDFFYKLQYPDLLRIHRLTNDASPWFPFLHLACCMFSDMSKPALSPYYRAGIKNLQGTALLWEKKHGQKSPELYSFDAQEERNFTRLAEKLAAAHK